MLTHNVSRSGKSSHGKERSTGTGLGDELPNILLVDDQPARLMTYEATLAGLPVRFVRALSGLEALQRLLERQFAVIVLDVSMPGMDGFEAARLIREHPKYERTPIIFVTGVHVSEFDRLKGYDVGAIDYISVPIVPEILRSKVAILVELYQRRTELQILNEELQEARARLHAEHSQAMKAKEDRLRAIFENPSQLTVVLEPVRGADGEIVDWRCTDANSCALRLLNEGSGQWVGRTVKDVFPHRVAHVFPMYQSVLATGQPAQYQAQVAGREFLVSLSRIDEATIVVTGMDVSDRQRAEVALRESEERFRSVFFDAGVGMVLIERDCTIRMANPAFGDIVGRPNAEVLGASCLAFTHPDDVQSNLQRLAQLVGGTDRAVSFEKRFVRPDQTIRWVRVNMVRLGAQSDGAEGLLAVVEDISDRVAAQHALEQLSRERAQLLEAERAARSDAESAMRAKDEFLATLSHELRTPLSNVVSWARLLQSRHSGISGQLDRGLKVIADNAMAQGQLISDLLDVSRLAAGKITLDTKPVELNSFTLGAIQAVRPTAEGKGVTLRFEGAPDVGSVLADPTRLQQIIWNLVANAVKFTPAEQGLAVSVRTRALRREYEIVVEDHGEGIDPKLLPQLFARFRQGDSSTARRHDGLGLGLALVKELVLMHGGSVEATSAGLGQGATFYVRLPKHDGATRRAAAEELAGIRRALHGVRILAVEDQPTLLEYLKQVLEEHGAVVEATHSAARALAFLKEAPRPRFDVIVSDLGLPELDGYEFMRHVRNELRIGAEQLPAIALTAYAREEDRAKAIQQGYQVHLAKPYHVSQLVEALQRLLDR